MQANKHIIDLHVLGLNARLYKQRIWCGQGAPNLDYSTVIFFFKISLGLQKPS